MADQKQFNGVVNFKNIVSVDDHLRSVGDAPALTVTTGGSGTCTIDATSTDVAGTLTFGADWTDGDTVLVTFNKPYATAPKVLIGVGPINSSGESLVEIDNIAITTAGFTLTASGTCVGALTYFVIETV